MDELVQGPTGVLLTYVWEPITAYGWYILALIIVYGANRHRVNKFLDDWYQRRSEAEYAAKYHKNPDLARRRLEELTAARERMQEEYNRKAAEALLRRQEIEERNRQERVQQLSKDDRGGGRRLNDGASTSNTLKPEYNPLMNDSGSRYRPPKKSCCKKGGGCG